MALSNTPAACWAVFSESLADFNVEGTVLPSMTLSWSITGLVSSTETAVVLNMVESASTLSTVAPNACPVTSMATLLNTAIPMNEIKNELAHIWSTVFAIEWTLAVGTLDECVADAGKPTPITAFP